MARPSDGGALRPRHCGPIEILLRWEAARPRRVLDLLARIEAQLAANFISLIASLFETHPPIRFVA